MAGPRYNDPPGFDDLARLACVRPEVEALHIDVIAKLGNQRRAEVESGCHAGACDLSVAIDDDTGVDGVTATPLEKKSQLIVKSRQGDAWLRPLSTIA